MTIQELVDWCLKHDIDMENTHIAMRAKDDYFLTEKKVYVDTAYFGNCSDGMKWERSVLPRDEEGDIDYDVGPPALLILDTGRG